MQLYSFLDLSYNKEKVTKWTVDEINEFEVKLGFFNTEIKGSHDDSNKDENLLFFIKVTQ